MPRWIDQQSTKAERQLKAQAEMAERHRRHAVDLTEIKAFRRQQDDDIAARDKAAPRAMRPGTRRLPDFSDEILRQALGKASATLPRMLDYPHLLIFRERGFTRQVWADAGAGEFGAPSYRGDVLTEVGERWLKLSE